MSAALSTSILNNSKNVEDLNVRISDMDEPVAMGSSEISKIFQNATVFITGGTGFLGSLYIEKLIRVAPNLRIYMLVRPKKNKTEEERMCHFLKSPIFDNLKRKGVNLSKIIIPISSDVAKPNLGMSSEDIEKIIKETNYIIHAAATVNFIQHIRISTYTNVRSTIDLIAMAKKMPQLKSFLYVSTAFSNCLQPNIDEKFYSPPILTEQLFNIVETFNDEELEKITPTLLKGYPSTYIFTKAMAEHVVNTDGRGLPISVIRPSMVIATSKEPLCGWIDNFYVPTGFTAGVILGVIRAIPLKSTIRVDMIPADFVVNCGIAALWKAQKESNEMKVYNCIISNRKPISLYTMTSKLEVHYKQSPTMKAFWAAGIIYTDSKYLYAVLEFVYQTLPAFFIDFYLLCRGKTPFLMKKLSQIRPVYKVLQTIGSENKFSDNNVIDLTQELSNVDKKEFDFNLNNLDWDIYLETYWKGIRVYLLKDPMTTVESALKRNKKFQFLHYSVIGVFWLVLISFVLVYFHS